MKTVSYKDPYEWEEVVVQIKDGEEKAAEEALAFLKDDTRLIENMERKERYHAKWSMDHRDYDGPDYASDVDVEAEFFRAEQERIIDNLLRDKLTPVQHRRFRYLMEGLSIHEIAEAEGVDYRSAEESIRAARKKLQNVFGNTPSETPSDSPYSGKAFPTGDSDR